MIFPEHLIQTFSHLPDWQSRYRQLIAQGDFLPLFPATAKNEMHLVKGCESQVWLLHQCNEGKNHFLLTSDAKIIRGLLAILLEAIQHQDSAFIATFNLAQYLQQLGLAQHLTSSRANGLQKVFATIQAKAAEY